MKVKRFILIVLIMLSSSFLFSCKILIENSSVNISVVEEEKVFVVGEKVNLNSFFTGNFITYVSSNESVITITNNSMYCMGIGNAVIRAYNRLNGALVDEILVKVVPDEITDIEISGSAFMDEGDVQTLELVVEPASTTKKVKYISLDESIAKVSSNGKVTAEKTGITTIRCYSIDDESIYSELVIFVKKNSEEIKDIIEKKGDNETEAINISDSTQVFSSIIDLTKQSVVGVNSYTKNIRTGTISLSETASGVVYKRTYITLDGEETNEKPIDNFLNYKYYVITNKHLVDKKFSVSVLFNSTEYEATVIASDSKVDISVLSFECTYYIPTCKIGNSDDVKTGEFILSIGKTYQGTNETVAGLGIISYNQRYVGTDTDSDEVNDWDALYIQHDSSISSYSTGGALVNLKGEIIGINSVMITASDVDDMSFAIPINLVMNLVSQLELGIVPKRPLLGVTVVTVKDIINKELTNDYQIPSEYNYGVYIVEVTTGGVASVAGVNPGDVILEFNGIKLFYSYELRAALNEIIIGSGEEVVLTVYREGKIIELKAVF